jgi:outer membrane protein TolC
VDLSRQLYTEGKTDFLNVLTAQGTLLSSEGSLADSRNAIAADLVALYKAMGGGWETSGDAEINTAPTTQPSP